MEAANRAKVAGTKLAQADMHIVHMLKDLDHKTAVKNLHSASQQVVDAAGLTNEDVTWVVPHQANLRIIEQVASRAKYPMTKVLTNLERVGNTSSASIPILLDEKLREGVIREGDVVLSCAFGAGVSWGAALMRM